MLQPLHDPLRRFTDQIVVEPSYIIFQDGNIVYAKNGRTGAIEFSSSDASSVIQQAINALPNGGKIFIKAGTYYISKAIVLANNVEIAGEGWNTKLIKTQDAVLSDGHASVFQSYGLSNVVIKDLYVEAPESCNPNKDKYIIDAGNTSNAVIDHIYLKQRYYGSGWPSGWIGACGIQLGGDNSVVQNSVLEGTGKEFGGGWGIGVGPSRCRIVGNVIKLWGHNGIMGAPDQGVIAYNVFYNNWDDAIDSNADADVMIIGNYFYNDLSGGYVGATVSLEGNCKNFIIAGNVIDMPAGGSIGITDSSNVVIVGNRFVRYRYRAVITGGNSSNIVVADNVISHYGYMHGAIEIGGTCNRLVVTGNTVELGWKGYFIYVGNNSTLNDALIANNHVFSAYPAYAKIIVIGSGVSLSNIRVLNNNMNGIPTDSHPAIIYLRNQGYVTDVFKSTGNSVSIGLNNTYGPPTTITSPSNVITYFKARINFGGTFGAGETVTVKIEAVYHDGTTVYVEKSATSVGSIWLTDDDILTLMKNASYISKVNLYAKTNLTSTSVTVTVDVYGHS